MKRIVEITMIIAIDDAVSMDDIRESIAEHTTTLPRIEAVLNVDHRLVCEVEQKELDNMCD